MQRQAVVNFFFPFLSLTLSLSLFLLILIMKTTFIQDVRHARICHILLMALFGPVFSFPTSPSIAIHAESHGDTATRTTEQYIVRIITVCILVVMGGFFAGKGICCTNAIHCVTDLCRTDIGIDGP